MLKFLKKNLNWGVLVFLVIVLILWFNFSNSVENFASDEQISKINQAVKFVLDDQAPVRNFEEFKKYLNYPNFDVLFFNDLLNLRKEKNDNLTREEIQKLIDENEYDDSFKLIETMDGSDEGLCVNSLKTIKDAMDKIYQRDEKRYQEALAKWETERKKYQEIFNKSPSMWSAYCGLDKTRCEPVDSFFQDFKQQFNGYDLPGEYAQPMDYAQCLRRCRNREDCQWALYRGGRCYLKGMKMSISPGNYNAIRTTRGYHNFPGHWLHGHVWKHLPPKGPIYMVLRNSSGTKTLAGYSYTEEECRKECDKYGLHNCHAFSRHQNGTCYLQHFPHTSAGWKIALKYPNISENQFSFKPNSKFLSDNIGYEQPKRTDFISNLNIEKIACQECKTVAQNITLEDIQKGNISQLQNCAIEADKSRKEEKIVVETPSQPPSIDTPTPTTNENVNNGVNNGNRTNNTALILGFGGMGMTSCFCLVLILGLAGFYFISKRKR